MKNTKKVKLTLCEMKPKALHKRETKNNTALQEQSNCVNCLFSNYDVTPTFPRQLAVMYIGCHINKQKSDANKIHWDVFI